MPNANDYESVYEDGSWKYKRKDHLNNPSKNPSTINPIQKVDGWIQGNDGNHPSHLTSSPKQLSFISAKEAMEADTTGLKPLWGTFLYPNSIHILNSVAGVGKTTLAYNLAVYGARGESFVNIPFEKPLSILYADLETSQALRASKLKLISENNPPEDLYFLPFLNIMDNYDELEAFVKDNSIEFIIIDTINEAFNTRDEQDNAEANRQFVYIKRLRDETACSILLLAHIGKGEQSHKVYSTRGASARAASVDVVLNLTEITDDEVCLAKEKDRIGGGKERLYLRKVGEDAFEVTEHNEDMETSLLVRVQSFILEKLNKGLTHTKEFVEEGAKASYSKPTIERALSNLYHAGKIDRPKKGVYAKIAETSKANNYPRDDLKDDGCDTPLENPSINNKHSVDGLRDLMDSASLKIEEILGMSREKAIKIWKRQGAPIIHLGIGENCFDLGKLLSTPNVKPEHLEVVKVWLVKVISQRDTGNA